MGLVKRNYTDRETVISADNMNDIQDAVLALEDGLFTIDNNKSGEVITITDAYKRGFRSLNIYGKTTQNGTPTPDSPADLVSVGNSGSITVSVSGENETKGMTIETTNGLPGIPVDSGGNYTDTNGQQWVCDEIDFARGVHIKRIGKWIVDGTIVPTTFAVGNKGGTVVGYNYSKVMNGISTNRTPKMCDKLQSPATAYPGTYKDCEVGFWTFNTAGKETPDTFLLFNVGEFSTAEEAAVYLQENHITFIGILATPIETPLSAEELAAYASLHTYKNSTTVSNDAGAWMDLEYVMDAKKYIDRLSISGGGGVSAPARLASVTLLASKWVGSGTLYSQVVSIDGITENSQVNLAPSVEQLSIFYDKDITFVTENDGGVVTVYVIGQKPQNDYTIQADIVEVIV